MWPTATFMNDDLAEAVEELLARDPEARRVVAAMCCSSEFFTHDRYRQTRQQLEKYVEELREHGPELATRGYHEALKRIFVDSYIR